MDSGSDNDEVFIRGVGNIHVNAGEGEDRIFLDDQGGHSTVTAGAGNDLISRGTGDSLIYAGEGANTIALGAGNDTISTGDFIKFR